MVFVAYVPMGKGNAQIWGTVTRLPADKSDGITVRGLYAHEFKIIREYFRKELSFDGRVEHSGVPGPGSEKTYDARTRRMLKWTSDLDIL